MCSWLSYLLTRAAQRLGYKLATAWHQPCKRESGAQNLLMSLWPISDEFTVQIMSDFYEAAHESGNAAEALAKVQRAWLVKLRKEKGLVSAVNLAGPFIMSSQGKP